MKLNRILPFVPGVKAYAGTETEVVSIEYDSRKAEKGSLFVALRGSKSDGHKYINKASENGASAVLCEELPAENPFDAYIVVEDSTKAVEALSAPFYGNPSDGMALIGVTGTSGKTTVTTLIKEISESLGKKSGKIGTLGAYVGHEFIPTDNTTPIAPEMQRLLRTMADKGAEVVAMECSSHGLVLGRLSGCSFDCGVFTNIARDHLDFHKTEEAYFEAKMKLFTDFPKSSKKDFTAVVNRDDPKAADVIKRTAGKVRTFGIENKADYMAENIEMTVSGASFDLICSGGTYKTRTKLGGLFNVYNALTAIAVCVEVLGFAVADVVSVLSDAAPAAGRFESVGCADFGVIVDYAHTPDELENVLKSARPLTAGKLIAVFGCGGDRDKGKRPIMGKIVEDNADVAVVTSDNPRTEDPAAIIKDILAGMKSEHFAEVDRYEAIRKALEIARAGDIVVVAGKGHEDYQIFADRTIHFDDREVVLEILAETGK
ncbi:MAG: UDP-N-acetylmuramoyl-L-alanyl-D-glutamate--2,6-diaminopimelate ligase [Abditibacteriota bacterium]|nr:UDP-N-acetylmuramoyl-L-alanyl-D-glutamate--2,6-diaminopimelate ligase [Abditibacteriota bacterium]